MYSNRIELHDVAIHPFYGALPLETEPVLTGARASYTDGRVLHHQFYALEFAPGTRGDMLRPGAAYSCIGRSADGAPFLTHWLYCTAVAPRPVLGITCDWVRRGSCAPLLGDPAAPLIVLEELSDLALVTIGPPPTPRVSQAQIGKRGQLVMSSLTAPHLLGIQIDRADLPSGVSEGTRDLTISAQCARTLQVIALDGLTCVQARERTLFLTGAA